MELWRLHPPGLMVGVTGEPNQSNNALLDMTSPSKVTPTRFRDVFGTFVILLLHKHFQGWLQLHVVLQQRHHPRVTDPGWWDAHLHQARQWSGHGVVGGAQPLDVTWLCSSVWTMWSSWRISQGMSLGSSLGTCWWLFQGGWCHGWLQLWSSGNWIWLQGKLSLIEVQTFRFSGVEHNCQYFHKELMCNVGRMLCPPPGRKVQLSLLDGESMLIMEEDINTDSARFLQVCACLFSFNLEGCACLQRTLIL